MRQGWTTQPKPRAMPSLEKEASNTRQQVLLSFMSDPYCSAELIHGNMALALGILRKAECSVAVLTKGGTRCLKDIHMFQDWPGGRVKVGATLTFESEVASREWEPGAAVPADRIEALRQLHKAGVSTWASIEPVIDPVQSLAIIEAALPYVDAYKVGKWNGDKRANAIDWAAFGKSAIEKIRNAGKQLYVKVDLRPYLEPGYLTEAEIDTETLTLPDRPIPQDTLF